MNHIIINQTVTSAEKVWDKYTNDRKYCRDRDHFHYTGKYRGAADSICSSKYCIPK